MQGLKMLKVNLVNFHCLILYSDMIQSKYVEYIVVDSLHRINNSINEMYLAKWEHGIRNV